MSRHKNILTDNLYSNNINSKGNLLNIGSNDNKIQVGNSSSETQLIGTVIINGENISNLITELVQKNQELEQELQALKAKFDAAFPSS